MSQVSFPPLQNCSDPNLRVSNGCAMSRSRSRFRYCCFDSSRSPSHTENLFTSLAVVPPLPRTQVFVNSYTSRKGFASCIVWEDQSNVPLFRDHRIVTVGSTLAVASGMHMNIGHNC